MKIYMQGNFWAGNSNMDVTFANLEYVTPGMRPPNLNTAGMTPPNLNTDKKGPTL